MKNEQRANKKLRLALLDAKQQQERLATQIHRLKLENEWLVERLAKQQKEEEADLPGCSVGKSDWVSLFVRYCKKIFGGRHA